MLLLANILYGWYYSNRLWRHFKSLICSFTKTRILKLGDNFSIPHILPFDSSSNGEGMHHKALRTSTWYWLRCNFSTAWQIGTQASRPMYPHYGVLFQSHSITTCYSIILQCMLLFSITCALNTAWMNFDAFVYTFYQCAEKKYLKDERVPLIF